MAELPDEAYVVAMASLPKMGPVRLRKLIEFGAVNETWAALCSRSITAERLNLSARRDGVDVVNEWCRTAVTLNPAELWQRHCEANIGVSLRGSAAFPSVLVDDDDPPAVLFWDGDIDHIAGARVAIVGTRRATRYGIDVANELARDLSLAGVSVVSGLALGIDSAAHAGAIAVDGAPPIAVVGSGLNHIYPRENRPLWRQVVERGVVVSEYPLDAPAVAWQFPARNRIIAALADVVVVVESQVTGGALGTAMEAARRGTPVLAVPGPVTAPSSAGTNQLLFDGCSPVRDASDVLLVLGLEPVSRRTATEHRHAPIGDDAVVLAALPWQSTPVEQLINDTGFTLGAVMVALNHLESTGWVVQAAGRVERVARASVNL